MTTDELYEMILAPIQMGEREPADFPVATRVDMEAVWRMEDLAVTEAEIRML